MPTTVRVGTEAAKLTENNHSVSQGAAITHDLTAMVKDVKRTVKSGGYRYNQRRIPGTNAWVLENIKDWLIPGRQIAILLGRDRSTISHYARLCPNASSDLGVYHNDAPTVFLENAAYNTGKVGPCSKQFMWTKTGFAWLINESPLKLTEAERKLLLQRKEFAFLKEAKRQEFTIPSTTEGKPEYLKSIGLQVTESEAQTAVSTVCRMMLELDQLRAENALLKEDRTKMAREGQELAATAQANGQLLSLQQATAQSGINLDEQESLSQFLARENVFDMASDLTRRGLMNTDQMYTFFNSSWVDPRTGLLINKNKFQAILRMMFHLPDSVHGAPTLKAKAMRYNYAGIARVKCNKKPNPTDAAGNKQDLNNPAYLSNSSPSIRLQVRYTAKAVALLRKEWTKRVDDCYSQGLCKMETTSASASPAVS